MVIPLIVSSRFVRRLSHIEYQRSILRSVPSFAGEINVWNAQAHYQEYFQRQRDTSRIQKSVFQTDNDRNTFLGNQLQ